MKLEQYLDRLPEEDADLFIDADLSIQINQTQLSLNGNGHRLNLKCKSAPDLWELLEFQNPQVTDVLERALISSGLTLEVSLQGRTLGLIGTDSEPGITSAIMGFKPIQLCPGNLLLEGLSYINPFRKAR